MEAASATSSSTIESIPLGTTCFCATLGVPCSIFLFPLFNASIDPETFDFGLIADPGITSDSALFTFFFYNFYCLKYDKIF